METEDKNKIVHKIKVNVLLLILILVVSFVLVFTLVVCISKTAIFNSSYKSHKLRENAEAINSANKLYYSNQIDIPDTNTNYKIMKADISSKDINYRNGFVKNEKEVIDFFKVVLGESYNDPIMSYKDGDKDVVTSITDLLSNEFFEHNNVAIFMDNDNQTNEINYDINSVTKTGSLAQIHIYTLFNNNEQKQAEKTQNLIFIVLDKEIEEVNFCLYEDFFDTYNEYNSGIVVIAIIISTIALFFMFLKIITCYNDVVDNPESKVSIIIRNIIIILMLIIIAAFTMTLGIKEIL
ncbi:MAG: hypothetical protein IKN74_01610 [Clostridia bacterium]|nr:hypothetical protein [Clostridia bacterium]